MSAEEARAEAERRSRLFGESNGQYLHAFVAGAEWLASRGVTDAEVEAAPNSLWRAPGFPHWQADCARCSREISDRLLASGEMTWVDALTQPMWVCPECGSKRCAKASDCGQGCDRGAEWQASREATDIAALERQNAMFEREWAEALAIASTAQDERDEALAERDRIAAENEVLRDPDARDALILDPLIKGNESLAAVIELRDRELADLLDERDRLAAEVGELERQLSGVEADCTDHYAAHVLMAEKAESERDHLTAVIESAPHSESCPAPNVYHRGDPPPCRCWKATALDVPKETDR